MKSRWEVDIGSGMFVYERESDETIPTFNFVTSSSVHPIDISEASLLLRLFEAYISDSYGE